MKISEVKNNAFYQMPQWLYDPPYNLLSDKAKQIYMFLFDRRTLSIQNKWFDEKGDVFVYYTNEQLMEKLNCSNKPIIQAKKMANSRLLIIFKSLLKTNLFFTMMSSQIRQILRLFCHYLKPIRMN